MLDEEECYLVAILDDPSGIELAEFCFLDETPGKPDPCFRVRDYQWPWWTNEERYQIDHCSRDVGKALWVDTPIPTPHGWTRMGDLRVGDEVYDETGAPTLVRAVYPQPGGRPTNKVTFDDGSVLFADDDHRWLTSTKSERNARHGGRVRTTAEIATTLRAGTEANHSIAAGGRLLGPVVDTEIDPYVFGYWLGDGSSQSGHLTVGDHDIAEVAELIAATGWTLAKVRRTLYRIAVPGADKHTWKMQSCSARLRRLGVLNNKHIPAHFQRASVRQRIALLQGLMDSDGHVTTTGRCEITLANERLAQDVYELLVGLGQKVYWSERRATLNGKDCGPCWRLGFMPLDLQPFRLGRKAERVRLNVPNSRLGRRYIVAVDPVASLQMVCIEVEAKSHLFLAGRGMVPTHNSQGIQLRAFAFPFNFPGQEMLITAPELNHLGPIVDKIEATFLRVRLGREMLPRGKGMGVKHQPQFQATFINGAKIMGRLPNKDGKGVKGCVAPGTMVLTRRGQVPIERVVVGDEVFTHRGRWQPVLATKRYERPDAVMVVGAGHRGLVMSDNHRMYGRRNRNPQRTRNLEPATWCIPGEDPEVAQRWYLASPSVFPAATSPVDPATAWVVGRYVADGYLARRHGTDTFDRLHVIVRFERCEDVVQAMKRAGLRPSARLRANGTYDVEVSSVALCALVARDFGQHADAKALPTWLLGAPEDVRRSFLDGYLSGDGHWDGVKRRWTVGTASKALAVGLRLLAQSLGYVSGLSWVDPKVDTVCERPLTSPPKRSWRVTMSESDRNVVRDDDGLCWQKVRDVVAVGEVPEVYEIAVAEDHSYIADGLISHNQHSHRLEMDEAQDYPQAGWMELVETMRDTPGAQWRAHGVSRGVRDMYYRLTQREDPDLPFYVHRYMAMHRPNWGSKERKAKIAIYGGTPDNPDYKRNVYGEHGDVTNPVFVLARLMACFVPGTLVTTPTKNMGLTPIELVEVGDVVGNAAGTGIVTDKHESWRDALVRVEIDNGEVLYCTPEHPFATSRGWDNADRLRPGDELWPWDRAVRGVRGLDPDVPQVLLEDLHREMAGSPVPRLGHRASDVLDMRVLPGDVLPAQQGGEVLLPALRQQGSADEGTIHRAQVVRGVSTGVCTQEGGSAVLFGVMSGPVGEPDAASTGASDPRADGRAEPSALRALAGAGAGMAAGVLGGSARGTARSPQLPVGPGAPGQSHGDRGGRPIAQGQSESGAGPATAGLAGVARVVRTEVLRPGHPEFARLSGGADQVRVIDLTVSGHPSFAVSRSRLLVHNCVRINESTWASEYNENVYAQRKLEFEYVERSGMPIEAHLKLPKNHLLAAYKSYWAGMDIGFTNDPSELLVFGMLNVQGKDVLRLLLRAHMMRISAVDQSAVIMEVFQFYGDRLKALSMDKTGNGLPIWQETMRGGRLFRHAPRIKGYGFSEKKAVEFDDRPLTQKEKPEDAVIEKNVVEFATDKLREYVDGGFMELPYDRELLTEWQGQVVVYARDESDRTRRSTRYGGGSFHTLDAAKMMILGKELEAIEATLAPKRRHGPVLDQFFG